MSVLREGRHYFPRRVAYKFRTIHGLKLTEHEETILRLKSKFHSNREIGLALGISHHTVSNILCAIVAKNEMTLREILKHWVEQE